MFVIDKFKVV